MSGRRQFLKNATSNLAAMATLGLTPVAADALQSDDWDLSWAGRITGKHKAVFDVAEIDSGFGVFRAAIWSRQCTDVLRTPATDVSTVVVLRAHAIALAFGQPFWDKYDVGRVRRVTHPVTLRESDRNPVLMGERDGLPAPLAAAALPEQIARGVTVLACNLALQTWVDALRERNRVPETDARREAVAALVPGVILQPSGVLAAILAQERGCAYLRAS